MGKVRVRRIQRVGDLHDTTLERILAALIAQDSTGRRVAIDTNLLARLVREVMRRRDEEAEIMAEIDQLDLDFS